ncbi:MAG: hypothetical protein M5R36_06635 [Deltaproteobacteria bacterium]|nr:hypothetical protein [Deltaproteobacteria bacterium]
MTRAWAAETDQARKDRLMLFLFRRGGGAGRAAEEDVFRPEALLAAVRLGRLDDFERLLADVSEPRYSLNRFHLYCRLADELANAGHVDRARALVADLEKDWAGDATAEKPLRLLRGTLDLQEHAQRLDPLIVAMDAALEAYDLNDGHPKLAAFERLLRAEPSVDADVRAHFENAYPSVAIRAPLFVCRAAPALPGLLDRSGGTLADFARRRPDDPALRECLSALRTILPADAARRAEWERFAAALPWPEPAAPNLSPDGKSLKTP